MKSDVRILNEQPQRSGQNAEMHRPQVGLQISPFLPLFNGADAVFRLVEVAIQLRQPAPA